MTNAELNEIEARAGAEQCKAYAMRVRHAADCPVGKHCEDPFCHFGGECSCELETIAQMARKDLPRVLTRLRAVERECAELRYQNSVLKQEMSKLVLAGEVVS